MSDEIKTWQERFSDQSDFDPNKIDTGYQTKFVSVGMLRDQCLFAEIAELRDRLKKAEAANAQLREAIDLLTQEHNRAQSEAKKAEAERDETRQFLDELQGEFDKQNTAFWATSEKLRIAEAELKAIKECNPNNALAVSASELLEALQACLDYGVMTGDEWVEAKARATIHAYASPIAAPVPATQPKAEISDDLHEMAKIVAEQFTYIDRETDQTCCGGCNMPETFISIGEGFKENHTDNCIVLRARAILAEANKGE